jgi:hypothetical protein
MCPHFTSVNANCLQSLKITSDSESLVIHCQWSAVEFDRIGVTVVVPARTRVAYPMTEVRSQV